MTGARHCPKRLLWTLAALLAIAVLAIVLLAFVLPSRSPVKLAPPSAVLTQAAQGLDEITIEAALLPDSRSLEVTQTLTLTSRAAEARNQLVLRTWPNAYQSADTSPCALEESYSDYYPEGFSSGALVMSQVTAAIAQAESQPVNYRYTDAAKTVLALTLPQAWQPEERLAVTLRYTVTLPRAANRFGVMNGFWALGNAFAIPAVWEDGAYRIDEYYPIGDPFLSDVANYTVTLTLPEGYTCAASAYPTVERTGAGSIYHFDAPAVRDFALAISDRYHAAQAMEGDVLVSVYAADAARAREALDYARAALRIYSGLYGDYPYQSLSLGEIDFPHGGMEYPGMAMLGSATLTTGGRTLEYAIAHEIAHQWWYAVVGSDPVNNAWQDEALCEYSLLSYVEARYGAAQQESLYQSRIAPSMRVTVPRGVTPGAPLSYFSSMSQYSTLVYGRGTALICALDQLTDGGMNAFLRQYYSRYRFRRATREDFTALLGEQSGMDIAPLMVDYLDTYIAQ